MITEGSLRDFSLPDLLQILAMAKASGTLSLRSEGRVGQLAFQEGALRMARLGDRQGLEAGAELFLWRSGVFDFDAKAAAPEGEGLDLEALTKRGNERLERWAALGERLGEGFSPRAWIYPLQMYADAVPEAVKSLGSGKRFADWMVGHPGGAVGALEELVALVDAEQVAVSTAPEEQLAQVFARMAEGLFGAFASISAVKVVDALEGRLNELARQAALPIRFGGGSLTDNLPADLPLESRRSAYLPLLGELRGTAARVYGEGFVERVEAGLLDELPPAQRPLWGELAQASPTAAEA